MGDCGLTGRKIIVDTYGGMARHGGGAFSGKDPSKVDRSAAYAARYVAKNVVAAGLADRAEVQVAYAIGVAHPVSLMVETFGTEKIGRAKILELIRSHFDLRPGAFRRELNLHRPIYQKTAAYGHFGREDHDFTWERTDKAAALREAAGLGAAVESGLACRSVASWTGRQVGAGGSPGSRPAARGRRCARSLRGSATPRNANSYSAPPAVSKSTVPTPQRPLEQRLAQVHVLDALEPGLVQLAGHQPALDRQPLVVIV